VRNFRSKIVVMDIKSAVALFVIRSLALLNLPLARTLGSGFGRLMARTNSSMYKVTLKNIQLCFPEMLPQLQRRLALESVQETCKTMAEAGLAWAGTNENFQRNARQIISVKNAHLLEEAVSAEKGVLLLSMHLGNWEWLTSYLPQRCDLMGLYKMAKMPGLEKAMLEARLSCGVKLVAGTRDGVEKFTQHYVDKKACIIVPDQEPSQKSGVWSEFFGMPALTPKFIHSLIQKNPEGVVLNSYVLRVPGGFEMVFEEVEPEIYSQDLATSASAMNKGFEKCIRQHPSQYQWEYKRFKKNKEGFYKGL